MFTFSRQDQVVTGKLSQKSKYQLPNFKDNEHQPIAAQHTPEHLAKNENPTNKMGDRKTAEGQDKTILDPPFLE